MNRAGRKRWASARTLADLGELTALWLEGKIMSQPGYCDPDPGENWGPDPETRSLVPVLAACNRAGFLTGSSQPGEPPEPDDQPWHGIAQRAGVTGFADDATLARLRRACEGTGLVLLARKASRWLASGRGAIRVTGLPLIPLGRVAGWLARHTGTGFGARLPVRQLRNAWTGYGECHADGIRAVCEAWQVTVVDPDWGRNDRLWYALAAFVIQTRCMWCQDGWASWFDCTCRRPCGSPACNRLRSVLAADVKPGMAIIRDDTSGPAVVASVTDPDADGMVLITPESGEAWWRVAGDWPLSYADEGTGAGPSRTGGAA
jgi:hypothetical protein